MRSLCVILVVLNFSQSKAGDVLYGGLTTPSQNETVGLKQINIKAQIRAWAVGVVAELHYINSLNESIETQFVFPVTDTSAVYRLEATIGNRTLKAVVKEREAAQIQYQQGIQSGRAAVLLENQVGSSDIYRLRLGNLAPGETAIVKIGYADEIRRNIETGELSVVLPAVMNPRYVAKGSQLESSENFNSASRYVAVSQIPYSMNFSAHVDLGITADIVNISSGHSADRLLVSIYSGLKTANVVLISPFVADHDFRLKVKITDRPEPAVYVEPGLSMRLDDAGVASWLSYDIGAAWIEPMVTDSQESKNEYWLVVDRSGSMDGQKIKSAASALILFIKSIPQGSMFNIVGFGSNYEELFPGDSVNYTESSVKRAIDYANNLDADFGGTEVLEPLEHIYSLQSKGRRCIILLTDGEVSNTDEVIDICQRNANNTRVFSLGIGEGASTALVNGVARVSNGLSEFVTESTGSSDLQSTIIGLLKMTTVPSFDNVKIDWEISGSSSVRMFIPETTDMAAFSGKAILQYAIIERSDPSLTGKMTFYATVKSKPVRSNLTFIISPEENSEADDMMPLHRLAAKARLQEIDDAYRNYPSSSLKEEAVFISDTTGVLSPFTAMVAVDMTTNETFVSSSGSPVFIEISRPSNYERMVEEEEDESYQPYYPSPVLIDYDMSYYNNYYYGGFGAFWGDVDGIGIGQVGDPAAPPQPPPPPPQTSLLPGPVLALPVMSESIVQPERINEQSDFFSLMLYQQFSGNWRLDQPFIEAVAAPGITSIEAMEDALAGALADDLSDETVSTLIAIAVLRTRFSQRSTEWQFLEQKAIGYLGTQSGISAADVEDLVVTVGQALHL